MASRPTTRLLFLAVVAWCLVSSAGRLNADDEQASSDRPKLIRQLGDPSWDLREQAQSDLEAQGIKALADLEAAAVAEGLDSEVEWRVLAIIRNIRWQLPEAVSPGVRDLFAGYPDLPPDERDDLVRLLAKRGESAAVPLSRVVQFDPEPALRILAARALLSLTPQQSNDEALLSGLQDLEPTAESGALIAQVLHRLERFEEARDALRVALEIDGGGPELQRLHAQVLEGVGDLGGAIEVLRLIVAESPDDLDAQLDLVRVLGALGEDTEVRQRFKAIRQRLSESEAPGAYVKLISRMRKMGYPEQAEATIRLAMDKFPFEPGLHGLLGDVQRDLKHPDQALLSYRIELRYLDPKGEEARDLGERIGALLTDEGLSALASETAGFVEALQQDRVDPDLHSALSERLAARGLVEIALEQARLAALLSPGVMSRRLALAERLLAAGQVADARSLEEELVGEIRGREARRALRTLQESLAAQEAGRARADGVSGSLNAWTWRSGMEADLEDTLPPGPAAVTCDPILVPGADNGEALVAAFLVGSAEVIGLDPVRGRRRLRFRPPEPDRSGAREHEEVVLSPAGLASGGDGVLLVFYNRTLRESGRPRSSAHSGGLVVYRVSIDDGAVVGTNLIAGRAATSLVVDPSGGWVVWLSSPSPGIARLSASAVDGAGKSWSHRWKGLALGQPHILNGWAMVATKHGILRLNLADGLVRPPEAADPDLEPVAGLQVDGRAGLVFRSRDQHVCTYDLETGLARRLLKLPAQSAGGVVLSSERVFVADRGGQVFAFELPGDDSSGGEPTASWELRLERTAWRSLMLSGRCLLGLSGAVDSYRGERTQVVVIDPADGRLLGRREVLRPASWSAVGEGTVVVAGGHVTGRAGFQVVGLSVGARASVSLDLAAELSDIAWELQASGELSAAVVSLERLLLIEGKRSSEVLGRLGRLCHQQELHDRAASFAAEALEGASDEQRPALEALLQEIEAGRSDR